MEILETYSDNHFHSLPLFVNECLTNAVFTFITGALLSLVSCKNSLMHWMICAVLRGIPAQKAMMEGQMLCGKAISLSNQNEKGVRNLNSFCTGVETRMQTWQHFPVDFSLSHLQLFFYTLPCVSSLTPPQRFPSTLSMSRPVLTQTGPLLPTMILPTHQLDLYLHANFLNHFVQKGGFSSSHPQGVTLAQIQHRLCMCTCLSLLTKSPLLEANAVHL